MQARAIQPTLDPQRSPHRKVGRRLRWQHRGRERFGWTLERCASPPSWGSRHGDGLSGPNPSSAVRSPKNRIERFGSGGDRRLLKVGVVVSGQGRKVLFRGRRCSPTVDSTMVGSSWVPCFGPRLSSRVARAPRGLRPQPVEHTDRRLDRETGSAAREVVVLPRSAARLAYCSSCGCLTVRTSGRRLAARW